MSIIAYGKTFQDERARDAYTKMKSESRKRALARQKDMNPNYKEDAKVRIHFASESKRFGIK